MKRRDRDTPHHPHNALNHPRRRRRRRRLQSMLLAGAAFVVPRAGSAPAPKLPVVESPSEWRLRAESPLVAEVTIATEFRLPPELAYEGLIQEAALRFSLAPALIRAVIQTESAFDAFAVSSVGAQGLMQLMPALASEMGVIDPFDPRENIMAGSKYLRVLLSGYDGDLKLALAGYNAGPGAVDHYHGIPPFEETQRYVRTIVDLMTPGDPEPEDGSR